MRLAHSGLLPTTSLPASATITIIPPAPQQAPLTHQVSTAAGATTASAPAPASASYGPSTATSTTPQPFAAATGGSVAPAVLAPGLQRAAVTVTASPARVPAPSRIPGAAATSGRPAAGEDEKALVCPWHTGVKDICIHTLKCCTAFPSTRVSYACID